tara:strand:+ start:742 stop:1563 length:822 start_codon:yes stop_codon:yes gene_type:complete
MSLATLTSLHRGLHEWATRAGNQKFLCDEQEAQLRRVLRDPTRRTQANVAAWMLGSWHLGNGMLRVLNGESEGFDEARQGQTLRRTALLARNSQYTGPRRGNKSRLPFSLLHGAWTSLLGLALHDPGAEPLYEFMMSLPDIAFSEKDSVAFFTRELLALRAGRRPNMSSRLGPFEEVMLHWKGDQRLLGRAMVDLLDWHLSEARSAGKSYDDPACRVFPVEIIAIQHVRQWVDLPMPRVDHPLMHTNLATMKPSLSWPQHELAAALERQLRSG